MSESSDDFSKRIKEDFDRIAKPCIFFDTQEDAVKAVHAIENHDNIAEGLASVIQYLEVLNGSECFQGLGERIEKLQGLLGDD